MVVGMIGLPTEVLNKFLRRTDSDEGSIPSGLKLRLSFWC